MNVKELNEKTKKSKCTQCPHAIGDYTERDCAFPDCVGGWEQAYKELFNELLELKDQYYQLIHQVVNVIPNETRHETAKRIIKQHETAQDNITEVQS